MLQMKARIPLASVIELTPRTISRLFENFNTWLNKILKLKRGNKNLQVNAVVYKTLFALSNREGNFKMYK